MGFSSGVQFHNCNQRRSGGTSNPRGNDGTRGGHVWPLISFFSDGGMPPGGNPFTFCKLHCKVPSLKGSSRDFRYFYGLQNLQALFARAKNGLRRVLVEDRSSVAMSEEELAVLQMALMRSMNSSNPYFKEGCGRLLYKVLDRMSKRRKGFSEEQVPSERLSGEADQHARCPD